jgi:hypothetical protein
MNNIVLILIMIIFLLIVVFIIIYVNRRMIDENYGLNCPNCDKNEWLGESDCYNCNNCGWCIDYDDNGSCTKGNASGPSYKNCKNWYYNGNCMWGPQCDNVGPVYYDNSYIDSPWYLSWLYGGWYQNLYDRYYYNQPNIIYYGNGRRGRGGRGGGGRGRGGRGGGGRGGGGRGGRGGRGGGGRGGGGMRGGGMRGGGGGMRGGGGGMRGGGGGGGRGGRR